jgi:dTMP kinase
MLYNEPRQPDNPSGSRRGRGRLITFEGIDGAGKSTQAEWTAEWLRSQGLAVLSLREPGGTPIGESIRQILLARANTVMCVETELLLFAAARAELVREVIRPALDAGQWVICDRFYDSTTAYQGFGRGIDREMISQLQAIATGGLRPDRTFLLDVSIATALQRLADRPGKADRLDGEDAAFMRRTREGYQTILEAEPDRVIRIDAGISPAEVHSQIICYLKGDLAL